jgi:hypothetical protein
MANVSMVAIKPADSEGSGRDYKSATRSKLAGVACGSSIRWLEQASGKRNRPQVRCAAFIAPPRASLRFTRKLGGRNSVIGTLFVGVSVNGVLDTRYGPGRESHAAEFAHSQGRTIGVAR